MPGTVLQIWCTTSELFFPVRQQQDLDSLFLLILCSGSGGVTLPLCSSRGGYLATEAAFLFSSFYCSAASTSDRCSSLWRNVLFVSDQLTGKMLPCLRKVFIQIKLVCDENQTRCRCFPPRLCWNEAGRC